MVLFSKMSLTRMRYKRSQKYAFMLPQIIIFIFLEAFHFVNVLFARRK